jgi:hypothetical protein
MQHAALKCAILAVNMHSTALARILLLEYLDTTALVPYVNARNFYLWSRDTPLCVCVYICLCRMHVCPVFSNFEITGVYGNWYNARNEKLKEEKEIITFFHQQQ